jgi:hypothetical protein
VFQNVQQQHQVGARIAEWQAAGVTEHFRRAGVALCHRERIVESHTFSSRADIGRQPVAATDVEDPPARGHQHRRASRGLAAQHQPLGCSGVRASGRRSRRRRANSMLARISYQSSASRQRISD